MEIVDAQIHSWRVSKSPHWQSGYHSLGKEDTFPVEAVLASMEAVGVSAAVLDAVIREPDGSLIYDNSYAEAAATTFPGVFASTTKYNHTSRGVEDLVADTRQHAGVLGIRVVVATSVDATALSEGAYERLLSAAERHDLPVFLMVSGHLPLAAAVARSHPNLQLVIDHFGLPQGPLQVPDSPPFRRLGELLSLAQFPNVAVKFSGAPSYSMEAFPYRDLWRHLHFVIQAFRLERLMWGSDLTRFRGLFTYCELLDYLRHTPELSSGDKELILGASLRRILRWPRAHGG